MTCQWPRLATPADLPRLISDDRVTWSWPPPGTEQQLLAFPELWMLVCGDAVGDAGDWYVTTLADMAGYFPGYLDEILLRAASTFSGPVAVYAGALGSIPVIYEVGKANHMRWISSTIKGSLGTLETWQFGINWGAEGSDPDITEAEAFAFAGLVRDQAAASWISVTGGASIQSLMSTSTKLVEVGVVQKSQTEGTDADGTGGNLEQKFETQWQPFTPTQPAGTGGSTSLPFEVACAVTLQTDHRGPSGRGRVYLPAPGTSAMDVVGMFTTTFTGAAGRFVRNIITGVEAGSPYDALIVSRRRIQLHRVTSIQTGAVPDSQRRRRRSQIEAPTVQWTRTP